MHMSGPLHDRLKHCTLREPLEKPSDHKGGPETDVLRLELSRECVQSIIEALQDVRAHAKIEKGSSQPNLGTLIKSWEEYEEWLNEDSV